MSKPVPKRDWVYLFFGVVLLIAVAIPVPGKDQQNRQVETLEKHLASFEYHLTEAQFHWKCIQQLIKAKESKPLAKENLKGKEVMYYNGGGVEHYGKVFDHSKEGVLVSWTLQHNILDRAEGVPKWEKVTTIESFSPEQWKYCLDEGYLEFKETPSIGEKDESDAIDLERAVLETDGF